MPATKRILFMLRKAKSGQGRLMQYVPRDKPEVLEARAMLTAAPIQFGAVYVEQDLGSDVSPDAIEISFVGGAENTQLSRIEVDGDQFTSGLSFADMIFDTADTGLGADLAFDGIIATRVGEFSAQLLVQDGSSNLVILLDGFDAGEKLTLAIDVDEVQGLDTDGATLQQINDELDPIASGAEFQGSQLTAYFTAPHYHATQGSAEFRNRYDENLDRTNLDLPRDDENGSRDRTAGAVGEITQTPLPVTLSGRVYEDFNANVTQDPGDPGIAGVELALFAEQEGSYVFTGHTTLTDEAGDYSFDSSLDLRPGTYEVRETQPDGYFSVGAEIGTVAGEASGTITTHDVLSSISIPVGGIAARHYNFAEARPASIRGRVHLSTPEGDCWNETIHHEALSGVTVQLFDQNGSRLGETTTDATGHYEFLNIRPGEYAIVQLTPPGLILGGSRSGLVRGVEVGTASENRISDIGLSSGDAGVEFDFCDHLPASLSGAVYHDRNDDGFRDIGEEGIAGAILSLLDENDVLVETIETDETGRYEFVGLRAGNYRVIELQPDHWLDGKDRAGTASGRATGRAVNPGDAIEGINLLWGDQAEDYNFGELLPGSLQGRVHLSTPEGDCWNINEFLEPVAGAVVQLMDDSGSVVGRTLTDRDGNYSFDNLAPGEYSIRQLTPDGLVDGGAKVGQVFGVERGAVTEVGDIADIRLNSDEDGVQYDFCEHKPAVLSGFVFEDDSNDGLRDSNEAPIAGVNVQLFDERDNIVAEAITDARGRYAFEGLMPGVYAVRQSHPEQYIDGLDSAGAVDGEPRGHAMNPGDQIVDISIGWGQTGEEYNFGELKPASLSGSVHSSPDENCWEDADALPLAGVHILLLGGDGRLIAETETDSLGNYRFENLAPGTYSVHQRQPNTVFDGSQRAGTSGGDASLPNQIINVELTNGETATNYDFCELPPSSISGFVFVDGAPVLLADGDSLPTDLSGIRDGTLTADDRRLPGVTLELREGIRGAAIDASVALPGFYDEGPIRTTTDEDGFYEFAGLPKGNYAVYELHPDGYLDGIDTEGTTSGIPINPVADGEEEFLLETIVNALVVPPKNDAIVRIALPPGRASQFNNFSEVLTQGEPFVLPPQELPPAAPPPPAVAPGPTGLYSLERALAPLPLNEDRIVSDGGYTVKLNTWHLSVIDGGQPRVARATSAESHVFPASLWQPHRLAAARWEIDQPNEAPETFYFGAENSIPITGDFNGDGSTEIGVFLKGHWFIDLNSNGRWDSQDLWAKLGHDGDTPVVGDWDGDGKDDIGIFGRAWPGDSVALRHERGLPDMDNEPDGTPKNMPPEEEAASIGRRVMKRTARGRLRADVIDHVFLYGAAGDIGVAGDWNGDGIDTIGVFRGGVWRLDVDGNGRWTEPDDTTVFGKPGDIPLVGDFNGDGVDDLAIVRGGKVFIDANGNRKLDVDDLVVEFDTGRGSAVVGQWAEDGADSIALFKSIDENRVMVARKDQTQ